MIISQVAHAMEPMQNIDPETLTDRVKTGKCLLRMWEETQKIRIMHQDPNCTGLKISGLQLQSSFYSFISSTNNMIWSGQI